MNIEAFVRAFQESGKATPVIEKLADGHPANIRLKGFAGSADSVFAAATAPQTNFYHLFILDDKEEAAYFLNNLQALLGDDKVLFFPMSHRRPYELEETDNSTVVQRAEVLNKINQSRKGQLIVTYPEALAEKVVTKKHLVKNTLKVSLGDELSIEFITDLLFEYHFERVEYVVEPGQFAVRGGIVDVFSFSYEHPIRFEFFGDEVDSIRTFDPASQLSEAKWKHATIVPNVQEKLLQESRESFPEFMPENTAVWIKNWEIAGDKINEEFKVAESAFQKLEGEVSQLPPEEKYISKKVFEEDLQRFSIIEFGQKSHLKADETVEFNIQPQPAFNKNFELLGKNLIDNRKKGFQNIIAAANAKQIERLYAIFEDIPLQEETGQKVNFEPLTLSLHEGFVDKDLKIACYTDHQIFERYHRFHLRSGFKKTKEALTIKELHGLNPGDFVTHIDHGIGKFGGLEKIEVNGKMQEAIRLIYKDNDILYVSIHSLHRIAKYTGKEGRQPRINKLGTGAWQALKRKTKKKVKDIAKELIKLYAKRKATKGFQFSPDNYLQTELEASFIYEDTPDQLTATQKVKEDMETPHPMDRLICGDVGFGKTEIAIRAAFKAVCDNKQVAVLVPTTILALQHYHTFKDRLKEFPCNVDYVNRFKTPAKQKATLKKVQEGEVDILIGTHRIVSKDVKFKDLGLLIIDEEQKFGVSVKEKLKKLRVNVDTLTLTATPIPRTLQFSLMGARDLSIINTPPPNRYPVITEVHTFNEEIIRDAVHYEVSRRGQVFLVHNRVQNIKEVAGMVQRLCPDVKVGIGHGKMDGKKLEDTMLRFIEGEFDVLVATSIVESGLDIPNANTIIINNAHYFGLSDLHQLRGRVGRTNKKAFCYLLAPPLSGLTPEARKRLRAIEQFSDLGSGFNISMRDLDIRGAGNLLGAEQSGFITDIGFEMYHKILDEAVEELKETEFKGLFKEEKKKEFVKDCQIDTDFEILLPDYYVNNITERLRLYKELDDTNTEAELQQFEEQLKDRFGPVPEESRELINAIRLRWLGKEIGFEKLILKNKRMIGYFIADEQSPYFQSEAFSKVLKYVQQNPGKCSMKQSREKLSLRFEDIASVSAAIEALQPVKEFQEVEVG